MSISGYHQIRIILIFCSIAVNLHAYANNGKTTADTTVHINVNAAKIVGQVNKNIYGYLLEHIYHSINGGLWGEMLASRSFEPEGSKGWNLDKNEIVSGGTRTSSLELGEKSWTNYDFTGEVKWEPYFVGVPAPWSGGKSDIRIIFRNQKDSAHYAFHIDADSQIPFSIEKISGSGRNSKTVVLTSSAGPDKMLLEGHAWHHFRIQCIDAKVVVFLDDREVIHFTDEQSNILTGNVGLLLNKTTGRFKNLKVVSTEGRVLWAGLPDEVKPHQVAPDWLAYGYSYPALVNEHAVNGDYVQKITVNQRVGGVKQQVFRIKAGENYQGSVWLRGDNTVRISIALQKGSNLLAQSKLTAIYSSWKKYVFKLKPITSADTAYFLIKAEGKGNIYLDQASLMAEDAEKTGGYRPDLYSSLSDLKPSHLRWPGGSYASGYDWKWGIGPQEKRVRLAKASWNDFDQNAFGTDEFLKLCKKINAEPLLVIRIGYNMTDKERPRLIREAQEWLEYCNGPISSTWGKIRAKNGHPEPYRVKYWEIDNEMWELGVEKYGDILREFVPALRKIDPSIKIIACGDFSDKGQSSDSVLFRTSAKYFDYISLHHYESPARYREGPILMAKKYKDEERWIAASDNPNIKIYVSEWNASETDWRTGLYAGGTLNVFEADTHIAMAAAALLFRRTDASGWNNAFINFNGNKWFPAPNYVIAKLYREHYQPNLLETTTDNTAISVVATASADAKKIVVKIVNPANYPLKVDLDIAGLKTYANAYIYVIAPGTLKSSNNMNTPNAIRPHEEELKAAKNHYSYVLPALSITVMEIRIEI